MYNVHLTHSLLCFEFVEFTLHYYVKRYKITKVKKKKCIYFRKEEFDRLMEKRLSKDDLLSITLD